MKMSITEKFGLRARFCDQSGSLVEIVITNFKTGEQNVLVFNTNISAKSQEVSETRELENSPEEGGNE